MHREHGAWDDTSVPAQALPKGVVVSDAFPPEQPLHTQHYLAIGPDGWLYLNQGAEGNLGPCSKWNSVRRCTITRLRPDGTQLQTYARGERRMHAAVIPPHDAVQ